MKKIIHLSDLHIGADGIVLEERAQNIFNDIILKMTPAEDYIIIITGDIVDNAERRSYLSRAQKMIQQLEAEGFTVLIIPGNHDCGLLGVLAFEGTLKRFYRYMYGTENIEWPKVDFDDDKNPQIAFIGLNSMLGEIIDDDEWFDQFLADGELGKKQLNKLNDLLTNNETIRNCKKVVYLHHHPFEKEDLRNFKHYLKDSEEFINIIQNRVDVLLFGHKHKFQVTNGCYNGDHCIKRCYNAATSTGKHSATNSVKPSIHRIIDLNNEPDHDYDASFNYGQDDNQLYKVWHNINEDNCNGYIIVEQHQVLSAIYSEVFGPKTFSKCKKWLEEQLYSCTY